MIKLVGLRRIIIIACIIAMNLVAAGIYFFAVGPMLSEAQSQTQSTQGQISSLNAQIAGAKRAAAFMKANMPKYEQMQQDGFFLTHNRFMLENEINKLREAAGISSFSYNVAAATKVTNRDADSIHYELLGSRISVDHISSPLDANIYMLAQSISKVFPVDTRLQEMKIQRAAKVDSQTLKLLSDGKQVNFVNASVVFEWITLVPNAPAKKNGSNGFRGR